MLRSICFAILLATNLSHAVLAFEPDQPAEWDFNTAVNLSTAPLGCCLTPPTRLHLSDPPYENYFFSDCHSASQVVITSPEPGSNLSLIGPRLLIAWPAGNSGVVAYFSPKVGNNGSLAIESVAIGHSSDHLAPLYNVTTSLNGISGLLHVNATALMTVALLGSIRTIRDFTEGPSILVPAIQDAIQFHALPEGGAALRRLWLDNITTSSLSFMPQQNTQSITITDRRLEMPAGMYNFSASFNYPQLEQLSAKEVLSPASRELIQSDSERTRSLSFLSYSDKLLAGAWRFLTYFGRDSMISLLLLQPILSEGQGGAVEAVIGAVLERINSTGTVCHEETIGDYATYLHQQQNVTSTAPSCSYIMIDSDYYLPIVMKEYFLDSATGKARINSFFNQTASLDFGNRGITYSTLALRNAQKIMHHAAPFAQKGGQTMANLRHLETDQIVGQWRDSTYGIGGGRIPFDVNTALVPAALRAISALASAGFFPSHTRWAVLAARYAQIWEDCSLDFFSVTVTAAEAHRLLPSYKAASSFAGPSQSHRITSNLTFHGLALRGNDAQPIVKVMNSDVAFRLFLLNTTHHAQLTALLNQTANHIRLPFPAGLSTDVGLLVANPAYGGAPLYAANFTRADYHGTVVWGWPMAMMAKGLERQLARCLGNCSEAPTFCEDKIVYGNVVGAYNHLWDIIEANKALLSQEVWSWTFTNGKFDYTSLGALSPTGES